VCVRFSAAPQSSLWIGIDDAAVVFDSGWGGSTWGGTTWDGDCATTYRSRRVSSWPVYAARCSDVEAPARVRLSTSAPAQRSARALSHTKPSL